MQIITLISDWGLKDHYVASVKGVILKNLKDKVTIIDITHQVPCFDVEKASYILRNCWNDFPEGTIHIIDVNSVASIKTPHVAVFYEGHIFIGADNGIFDLLFDEKPDKILEIDVHQDSDYFTFPTKDLFVKVAVMLVEGLPDNKIGTPIADFNTKKSYFEPTDDRNVISGIIMYVDNYSNAITNISKEHFKRIGKNRKYIISFGSFIVDKIYESYDDVGESDIVVLFNISGYLEIAQNRGRASQLLGVKYKDKVKIEFFD